MDTFKQTAKAASKNKHNASIVKILGACIFVCLVFCAGFLVRGNTELLSAMGLASFDVDSEVAQKRVGTEKDRMESEGMEFHKKVRYGYLELAQTFPFRIKVINANKTIEEVFEETKKILNDFLAHIE